MTRLPRVVKIGHADFRVVLVSKAVADKGDFVGKSDPDAARILLKRGLPRAMQAETLLHEILHCCWWMAALPERPSSEEQVVSSLSPKLAAVLRDNPALRDYLSEALS